MSKPLGKVAKGGPMGCCWRVELWKISRWEGSKHRKRAFPFKFSLREQATLEHTRRYTMMVKGNRSTNDAETLEKKGNKLCERTGKLTVRKLVPHSECTLYTMCIGQNFIQNIPLCLKNLTFKLSKISVSLFTRTTEGI